MLTSREPELTVREMISEKAPSSVWLTQNGKKCSLNLMDSRNARARWSVIEHARHRVDRTTALPPYRPTALPPYRTKPRP